jgi:hypothetical protein
MITKSLTAAPTIALSSSAAMKTPPDSKVNPYYVDPFQIPCENCFL